MSTSVLPAAPVLDQIRAPSRLRTRTRTRTTISPRQAALAWARGAVVADLRTSVERARGALPGAVALADLIGSPELILVCQDGHRSARITLPAGVARSVAVVAGGYTAWRRTVWREWGEFLMADPGLDVSCFFRLLR